MNELRALDELTDSFIAQQSQTINDFLCRNHEFQSAKTISAFFSKRDGSPINKPSLAASQALWKEKTWIGQGLMERWTPVDLDVILISACAFTPNGYIGYPQDEEFASVMNHYNTLIQNNPKATKVAVGFHCQMVSSCTMEYTWLGPVDFVIDETGIYKWKT